MNKTDAPRFKPFAQSELPDTRLFKADILLVMNEVRRAITALQDKLYVLESLLEEADNREEEPKRRC